MDDLNHWVGHLGRNPQTKTPNIDRLAKMGVTFTRANCAAPVCNPSRAALMSGLRASTTGVYDNGQDWKLAIPKEQTLTTQFLKAGYYVFGAGKIYHSSDHRPGEWTDYFEKSGGGNLKRHPSAHDDGVGGIKFYPLDCADEDMPDYKVGQLRHREAQSRSTTSRSSSRSAWSSRTCRSACPRSTSTCSRWRHRAAAASRGRPG